MTASSLSTAQLREILERDCDSVVVVDIRPETEREWMIPGSVGVDAYDAVGSGDLGALASLDLGGRKVVTVCALGRTAARATELLRRHGVDALTL